MYFPHWTDNRIDEHIPKFVPSDFALSAYPNPFNPTTTLSFTLPHLTNVTLKIHDILGREVERFELGNMTAGAHEFKVNGDKWASGLYFATLETPVFSRTQKLLLLR
ncbi:MAG: T9SS type A sorting domain-containing protein [bacterium]|nr:T9SS type A sorting domain-containing protein [bacterium]